VHEITTEAELRGDPVPAALAKGAHGAARAGPAVAGGVPVLPRGHQRRRRQLRRLPEGDPAGFTLVLDDRTIAVPERAGNRRADGYRNILANPHVGLLYLPPGRGDTLRINGRARLTRDPDLLDRMLVKGHRPVLAMVVEVEQVFHHCAKAFLRSELWDPATGRPDDVLSRARIAHRLERRDERLEDIERYYGEQYTAGLYPTATP
jgi:uncharacterized protein